MFEFLRLMSCSMLLKRSWMKATSSGKAAIFCRGPPRLEVLREACEMHQNIKSLEFADFSSLCAALQLGPSRKVLTNHSHMRKFVPMRKGLNGQQACMLPRKHHGSHMKQSRSCNTTSRLQSPPLDSMGAKQDLYRCRHCGQIFF